MHHRTIVALNVEEAVMPSRSWLGACATAFELERRLERHEVVLHHGVAERFTLLVGFSEEG